MKKFSPATTSSADGSERGHFFFQCFKCNNLNHVLQVLHSYLKSITYHFHNSSSSFFSSISLPLTMRPLLDFSKFVCFGWLIEPKCKQCDKFTMKLIKNLK